MTLFSSSSVEADPQTDFDLLPKGTYEVIVTKAEMVDTKKGDGKGIPMEFTIVGEKFNSRKIWDYIIFEHPNEVAQNIGRQKLKQICEAIGKPDINDISEIMHATFMLEIKHETETWQGDTRKVAKFKSASTCGAGSKPKVAKDNFDPNVPDNDDDIPF